MAQPVTIRVNGRELKATAEDFVLNVAMDNGIFIPHYCWHPGLRPEGNCRICLVQTNKSRKLEVACMTKCSDGLEVETETDQVRKARRDVLEFLLINHPLDCPVCDKSGECLLQDYTYRWRGGLSRFLGVPHKEVRPTKDLGPKIRFWGARCILCTRCVRFLEDVSGSAQLTVVQRGDRSWIDTAPGTVLDDPLQLNTVDLCPVGALISKDFLYRARVWYAKKTPGVCATCSTGCSVNISTLDNEIKRIEPRRNPEVNGYWMCDEGRLAYRYLHSHRRLTRRVGTPEEAARAMRRAVEKDGPDAVAALISTANTCEEMDAFRAILGALGVRTVGFLTKTVGQDRVFRSGFTIHADRTPNTAYARRLFGEEPVRGGTAPVARALAEGRAKLLWVVNAIPDLIYPREIRDLLDGLEGLIVIDILRSPLSERANVLLPAAAWAERSGTYVNFQGRRQEIRPALVPPGEAEPAEKILGDILRVLRHEPVRAAA